MDWWVRCLESQLLDLNSRPIFVLNQPELAGTVQSCQQFLQTVNTINIHFCLNKLKQIWLSNLQAAVQDSFYQFPYGSLVHSHPVFSKLIKLYLFSGSVESAYIPFYSFFIWQELFHRAAMRPDVQQRVSSILRLSVGGKTSPTFVSGIRDMSVELYVRLQMCANYWTVFSFYCQTLRLQLQQHSCVFITNFTSFQEVCNCSLSAVSVSTVETYIVVYKFYFDLFPRQQSRPVSTNAYSPAHFWGFCLVW